VREVVLDIETVPCSDAEWRALLGKAPALKRKLRGDSALDWALGHVVCIGMIFLEDASEHEWCEAGPDEAALLQQFWAAVRPEDRIIGHNVLGFDLPYLQARTVVCQVEPSRRFDLRRYSTNPVYDTMQVWANWDRQKFPKLETLAAVLGLQGKRGSGDQVAKWFAAKDWARIKEYCMQDVRLTRDIYRRFKEFGL
jgi:DNA polymerase elongation subunit (family B)